MSDQPLELSEVLARLRRADESLKEFVAPLWPGVVLAAAWIEGHPRLFHLEGVPEDREGYFLLGIGDDTARVLRDAEEEEIHRYRKYLTKASVILLGQELAFPASPVERLQGILGPRPIHFAHGEPLTLVHARYDGLNLLFDGIQRTDEYSEIEELFEEANVAIYTPGEMFGLPSKAASIGDAHAALEELQQHPEKADEFRLKAMLDTAGAVLEEWAKDAEGYHVSWRHLDEVHTATLRTPNAPITSGISLAGARTFDPAVLMRLLVDHVLDGWR